MKIARSWVRASDHFTVVRTLNVWPNRGCTKIQALQYYNTKCSDYDFFLVLSPSFILVSGVKYVLFESLWNSYRCFRYIILPLSQWVLGCTVLLAFMKSACLSDKCFSSVPLTFLLCPSSRRGQSGNILYCSVCISLISVTTSIDFPLC